MHAHTHTHTHTRAHIHKRRRTCSRGCARAHLRHHDELQVVLAGTRRHREAQVDHLPSRLLLGRLAVAAGHGVRLSFQVLVLVLERIGLRLGQVDAHPAEDAEGRVCVVGGAGGGRLRQRMLKVVRGEGGRGAPDVAQGNGGHQKPACASGLL
eukprot:361973-Chlamydomonas_euryale.AAC.6